MNERDIGIGSLLKSVSEAHQSRIKIALRHIDTVTQARAPLRMLS
jgi:hypothetical protein